jgi:hypothetical protein
MLFKLLFWAVLLYYIVRTIGNLIRASSQNTRSPGNLGRNSSNQPYDIKSTRTPVGSNAPRRTRSNLPDIEDAKWTEVS